MADKNAVYKCNACGMITEVFHPGKGTMTCCGKDMMLKEANTAGAEEKHKPVVEKTANGIKISVGAAAHPMDEDHYIEWIEVLGKGGKNSRFFWLKPGDSPTVEMKADVSPEEVIVRSYCNLHGLWKSQ